MPSLDPYASVPKQVPLPKVGNSGPGNREVSTRSSRDLPPVSGSQKELYAKLLEAGYIDRAAPPPPPPGRILVFLTCAGRGTPRNSPDPGKDMGMVNYSASFSITAPDRAYEAFDGLTPFAFALLWKTPAFLGVPSPFLPGILLFRKPRKTQGNSRTHLETSLGPENRTNAS